MEHINRSRGPGIPSSREASPLEEPSQGDRKPDQVRATTSIPAALTPACRDERASRLAAGDDERAYRAALSTRSLPTTFASLEGGLAGPLV
jgi:hypothetical protein